MDQKPRRRVWVQHVDVSVRVLETRLDVAEAQGLGPDQQAAADGVRRLLRKAADAAHGVDPPRSAIRDWWGGTLVEAAYQNLHAARAQMVDVLDDAELAAEIPMAVARTQATMHRDDPRRLRPESFAAGPVAQQRALLRRAIDDGYAAMDRQHERLRSFRNIILILAFFIALLVGITVGVVSRFPTLMPLCFAADGAGVANEGLRNCPTGSGVDGPSGGDIYVVMLLGLLGGALAATVSIRNLRGTSTPYDVPVALALLKVPLGAFTAILGLIAIQGDFVPGLSELDSQQQILAYALVLGYGQQVFTRSLDNKAQTLLDALPGKDSAAPGSGGTAVAIASPPPAYASPRVYASPPAYGAPREAAPERPDRPVGLPAPVDRPGPDGFVSLPEPTPEPTPETSAYLPPPVDEADEDLVQDDGTPVMYNVPAGDHR